MSIKLIVDSGCDLPANIIEQCQISVLPGLIQKEEGSKKEFETYYDTKNEKFTLSLYRNDGFSTSKSIETAVPPVEKILDYLIKMTDGHDNAIVQVISRTTSPAYLRVNSAAKDVRGCNIRLIDTKTGFSGQGLVAFYTHTYMTQYKKQKDKEIDVATLRRQVERFTNSVYTYVVPPSVDYLHKRARKKRVESDLNGLTAWFAGITNIVPVIQFRLDKQKPISKIRGHENAVAEVVENLKIRIRANELTFNVINISVATESLEVLDDYPSLVELDNLCSAKGIRVFRSRMSNAGAVNLGPGTLSISFAAKKHNYLVENKVDISRQPLEKQIGSNS